MNDLYQRLDKSPSRKVAPRTHDGFVDSTVLQDPDNQIVESAPEQTSKGEDLNREHTSLELPQENKSVVETSKSKLLTLEVGVRKDLDLILYEHPEVSWDTLLEAALITCLGNQNTQKKTLKLAAERLTARKKSAVYKRTKTMAEKYT
jgi:hypothetical protein